MDEAELIRELYREYWRCMIAKDADELCSMMTYDYYLLHMTGTKQSAEVFLKGLLDIHLYPVFHQLLLQVLLGLSLNQWHLQRR